MDPLEQVLNKYATSQSLMDQVRYTAESLSLGFDRWGEEHVSGPSLYRENKASASGLDPEGEADT